MTDSSDQPISEATLGSNKINTDVTSNQRAEGGVDEVWCPHCIYFRQYFQHGRRRSRGAETEEDTTKESLKVCFVETHTSFVV